MKKIFLATLVFFIFGTSDVLAYQVVEVGSVEPLTMIETDVTATETYYLGELDGYPEVFEFEITAAGQLTLSLRAVPDQEEAHFSGLLVRVEDDSTFSEVASMPAALASWEVRRDALTGLKYLAGSTITEELEPGTYRFEVSGAEEHKGKYIFILGEQIHDSSFGENWQAIKTINAFYENGSLGYLNAPVIRYTLGVLVMLGLFGFTIYYTRRGRR